MFGFTTLTMIGFSQGQNWKLSGNNISNGDYLGTNNNEPMIFKANGNEGLRIMSNGDLRIKNFDDNSYNGLMFINSNGVLSKLNFTGNSSEVLLGSGTFGSIGVITGWTLSGSNLITNYNVGIGTGVTPEKLTVNGNILANGSISGTSLNVVDIVGAGKEFKIATSLCLKGIDVNDPNSRNQICGLNGDLYVQSMNNSYNTIINYGNNGKVGIGVVPTENFHVGVDAKFEGKVTIDRISLTDTVLTIGDSTLNFVPGTQNINGGITGTFRGLGLGVNSYGLGKWSTAIGYKTRANAEGSITIGGGYSSSFFNLDPYTLYVGFKSNLPTLVVTPGNGVNTVGKVGIGTSMPGDLLQIGNDYTSISFGAANFSTLDFGTGYMGFNATRQNSIWTVKSDGAHNGGVILFSGINGEFRIVSISNNSNSSSDQLLTDQEVINNTKIFISKDGGVGIGTECVPTGFNLAVDGKIITEEVNIQINGLDGCWPDYVFSETYQLQSLDEVENYVKKNHHLEGIPSAIEIERNGINLAEMNAGLLKKTEELTLYLIEIDKKLEELKKENELLKTKIIAIENNTNN